MCKPCKWAVDPLDRDFESLRHMFFDLEGGARDLGEQVPLVSQVSSPMGEAYNQKRTRVEPPQAMLSKMAATSHVWLLSTCSVASPN